MSVFAKYHKSKLVYHIKYQYTDHEIGELISQEDYVKDLHNVVLYLQSIEEEHHIVDAAKYGCRSDVKIQIKQVFIPEKKYVSLFNV